MRRILRPLAARAQQRAPSLAKTLDRGLISAFKPPVSCFLLGTYRSSLVTVLVCDFFYHTFKRSMFAALARLLEAAVHPLRRSAEPREETSKSLRLGEVLPNRRTVRLTTMFGGKRIGPLQLLSTIRRTHLKIGREPREGDAESALLAWGCGKVRPPSSDNVAEARALDKNW
jgi:hypothetical protein